MRDFLDADDFELLIEKGEVVINTVFLGGGYIYLLNQSCKKPLLIVDAREKCNNLRVNRCLFVIDQQVKEYLSVDLLEVLPKMRNSYICLNHLVLSQDPLGWLEFMYTLKADFNYNIKVSIHDYYYVCPTVNLLDYNMNFCNIPEEQVCNSCLYNYSSLGNEIEIATIEVERAYKKGIRTITGWRDIWANLFLEAISITFPSVDTKKRYLSVYDIEEYKISVLHHDLSYLSRVKKHSNEVNKTLGLNIYTIGSIGINKGSRILYGVLKMIELHKLPIYINVIGDCIDTTIEESSFLKKCGEFNHASIHDILNNTDIDCFIMSSICPETFSYTTQEMIATGLPVISFNIGAQGDFISKYNNGILLDSTSAEAMFEAIYVQYKEKLAKQLIGLKHDADFFEFLLASSNELMAEKSTLISEKNQLLEDVQTKKLMNKDLNSHIDKLDSKIIDLKAEVTYFQKELEKVKSTISWRLTRPFRFVFRLLMKFRIF